MYDDPSLTTKLYCKSIYMKRTKSSITLATAIEIQHEKECLLSTTVNTLQIFCKMTMAALKYPIWKTGRHSLICAKCPIQSCCFNPHVSHVAILSDVPYSISFHDSKKSTKENKGLDVRYRESSRICKERRAAAISLLIISPNKQKRSTRERVERKQKKVNVPASNRAFHI